jgi:hypothetical protein
MVRVQFWTNDIISSEIVSLWLDSDLTGLDERPLY